MSSNRSNSNGPSSSRPPGKASEPSAEARERDLRQQLEMISGIGCLEFEIPQSHAQPQRVFTSARALEILDSDPDLKFLSLEQLSSLIHESSRQLFSNALLLSQQSGRGFDLMMRMRTAKGRDFWGHLKSRGSTSAGGIESRIVATIEDVTHERDREREMQLSSERFQAVAEHVPLMMSVFDSQGNFEWVNQHWVDVLGWDLASMQGRDVMHEFYPDPRERQQAIDFMLSGARAWHDFELRNREGRQLSTAWANVRLSNGTYVGIGKDVSDQRAMEKITRQTLERLEFVLQSASVGIADWWVQDNLIQVDRVFCQLLGWPYPAEPRSREQFTQLFHPDEVQTLLGKFDAVFDGQAAQVEALFRLRHSEGRWVWVLTRGRVLERDASGKVRRYSGIFIEITRQRELELRYQETQKVLQQYFEISVDPFCITDFNGQFRTVNPAMCKILGYSEDEFLNFSSYEILHPDDWKATEAVVRRLGLGERIVIENRIRAKDGSYRTFSWHAIADERRELIYCSVRDVTEQRSAEMKAVDAARLASLGEMASGIAHEINNPLAIIKGKCEVILHQLKQQKFEPTQGQVDLGKIVETVERISRIVQALRVIARDSKNEELSQGNIHQIVDEVLAVSAERFRHSGIELHWSPAASSGDAAIARCRPVQVGQVILNLLNNSFDAVTTLPKKWVRIEVRRQDAWVEISVTDSGNGIPPEVLPRLMQPFFTTKGVGRGTGIGLSVSKSMIESQGGRFFYDDKSPHTRFVVQLALL